MKNFEDSDFAVVFTGEAPAACVITGWENVLNYLDKEATNGTPEESYRDPDWTAIHDWDHWTHFGNIVRCEDGDDRFQFDEPIGECCHVTVIRLTH